MRLITGREFQPEPSLVDNLGPSEIPREAGVFSSSRDGLRARRGRLRWDDFLSDRLFKRMSIDNHASNR